MDKTEAIRLFQSAYDSRCYGFELWWPEFEDPIGEDVFAVGWILNIDGEKFGQYFISTCDSVASYEDAASVLNVLSGSAQNCKNSMEKRAA